MRVEIVFLGIVDCIYDSVARRINVSREPGWRSLCRDQVTGVYVRVSNLSEGKRFYPKLPHLLWSQLSFLGAVVLSGVKPQ